MSPVVLLWHLLPAWLGIPPTRRCVEKPHPVDVVWAEPTAPKSNLFGPTGIHMLYTNIGVLYITTYPRYAHYAIVKIFEKRKRIKVKAKWKILNVSCNAEKQRGQFSDNENECLLLKISSIYLNLSEPESENYSLFYFIVSPVR